MTHYNAVKKLQPLFGASILTLALLMGCKDAENTKAAKETSFTANESRSIAGEWPVADSIVGGIPLYKEFGSIEPLFHLKNDTTYVLNFWATWCKPCLEELPYFEEFNDNLTNEKVKVVLISLDFPKKIESHLVPFVRKKKLNSTVVALLDGNYNAWIDKVSPKWSGAIPITYIYNREKNRLVSVPFENLEELNDTVQPFL